MIKLILKAYQLIKLYIKSTYQITCRKHWDYFEYEKLSKPFDIFNFKTYPCNKFYGINKAVITKIGKKLPKYTIIEHGVYFANIFNKEELFFFKEPIVFTMGQERVEFLKDNGIKNVHSIGPYIKYVSNFKNTDQRNILKNKLGKTLLVFPSHSIEGVEAVFNEKQFLDEIIKYSKGFNTTLICMYWKDIIDNKHIIYEKAEFTIVAAGYRNDPYFLSRLKDLIELSDMTMSNSLGTHIGYSIALGKPHYLFKQTNSYNGQNLENENKYKNLDELENRKNIFYQTFGIYSESITNEQINLVTYYWGNF